MTIATSAALGTVLNVARRRADPRDHERRLGVGPMPGPGDDAVGDVGGGSLYIVADKGDAAGRRGVGLHPVPRRRRSPSRRGRRRRATCRSARTPLELDPISDDVRDRPAVQGRLRPALAGADDLDRRRPGARPAAARCASVTAGGVAAIFGGADVAATLAAAAAPVQRPHRRLQRPQLTRRGSHQLGGDPSHRAVLGGIRLSCPRRIPPRSSVVPFPASRRPPGGCGPSTRSTSTPRPPRPGDRGAAGGAPACPARPGTAPLAPGCSSRCIPAWPGWSGAPTTREQRIAAAVLGRRGRRRWPRTARPRTCGAIPRPEDDPVDVMLVERPTREASLDAGRRRASATATRRDLTPVLRQTSARRTSLAARDDLGAVDPRRSPPSVARRDEGGWPHRSRCATPVDVHARRGRHGVPAFRRRARRVGARRQADRQRRSNRRCTACSGEHGLPPVEFHRGHRRLRGRLLGRRQSRRPRVRRLGDARAQHSVQFERDRVRDASWPAAGYVERALHVPPDHPPAPAAGRGPHPPARHSGAWARTSSGRESSRKPDDDPPEPADTDRRPDGGAESVALGCRRHGF